MYSEKLMNALIVLVVGVLLIKFFIMGGLFKSNAHKGHGYSIVPPAGWEKVKEGKGAESIFASSQKPEIVTFIPPARDPLSESPEATLSILNVKLDQSMWIEDEFPSIIEALSRAGYRVIDKGQIMIDTQIFHWVFYEDPTGSMLNLEFYTVDEVNNLYRIQLTATLEGFYKHRPAFEAAKKTIKFSGKLW
jgi:hypothetical protein